MKNSFLQPKKPYLVAVIALGILTGFIAFLVGYNYLSQVELQKSILKNYHQKLRGDAIALSYFFSERRDDLKNLPARREIVIFFENQALGMSMEYGLGASLNAVKRSFELFQGDRKLDGKRVYTRLVFIDRFGKLLVDSKVDPGERRGENWDRFLTPDKRSPFITVQNLAEMTQVMVSSPFFFKGNYSGQILAWIAPATINGYLSGTVGKIPHNVAQIFSVQGNFYFPVQPNGPKLPDVSRKKQGTVHRFTMTSEDGGRLEMIAEWAHIAGTPLGLVEAMPAKELLGGNTPWHLLWILGLLSALFLLGIGLIWRTNNRNLALHIRLEEGALRQREIQEKNQQLLEEISERQRVESALRKSEERFRSLFENAVEGVFQSTLDGRFLNVNPAMAGMLGYGSPEEMLKEVTDISQQLFVHQEQWEEMKRLLAAHGTLSSYEIQHRRRDGEKIWVSENLRVACGDDGREFYEGFAENITPRKQVEEEIRSQRDQLRALATRLAEVEESERQRLARELHDQVCQNLACISISLETIMIRAHREPLEQFLSRLADVGAVAEQTAEITRDIMEGLRPTVLDHYGLMGGLRQLGSQFSQRTGIDMEVWGEAADFRLTPKVELALFRIAQETLNNVAKHAQASKVVLTEEVDQDIVRLVIADNGAGFDQNLVAHPKAGRGWGLVTMTERAMAVGGTFRIESKPGQGTRVIVEVRR